MNEALSSEVMTPRRTWRVMLALWMSREIYSYSSDIRWVLLLQAGLCIAIGVPLYGEFFWRVDYRKQPFTLRTKGFYRLTRHPIYHLFFILDSVHFFQTDVYGWFFWPSWIMFTLVVWWLCVSEEQEVISQWGESARRYYEMTPRFLFQWIWFRRPRVRSA